MDGSRGEFDWLGAPVPFEEMPLSVDPPERYLIAANQQLLPPEYASPYYFGWQYAPPFRARRIDQVLKAGRRFTPGDMVRLQFDSVDLFFRDLIPVLLRAFPEPPEEPEARLALRLLQGWDGRVEPRRVEPTIAWEWLEHYVDAVWADNWADANLSLETGWQFSNGDWQPPLDVLLALSLQEDESEWFDDLRTPEIENRDLIIRRSFLTAIRELITEFGPGLNAWTWSSRNRMVIPDLLNDPNRAQNIEPVPGNLNTICPGGAGGAVTRGAVYRMMIPIGAPQSGRGASPGTQAGVPPGLSESTLFRQQLQSYLTGSYVPLYYYSYFGDFPVSEIAHLYTFTPKGKSILNERFPGRRRQ
jgi:penicillin amidase